VQPAQVAGCEAVEVIEQLPAKQARLLEEWLPGAVLVADHGRGLVGRRVLEIEHEGESYVVKAGPEADHRSTARCGHTWSATRRPSRPRVIG
jgi:hypothetical protein